MTNSEIRKFAKDLLPGGKAVLGYLIAFIMPGLIFGVIFSITSFIISIPIGLLSSVSNNLGLILIGIFYIAFFILSVILATCLVCFAKLFFYEYLRTRKLSLDDYFKPLKHTVSIFCTFVLYQIYINLWTLLFVIPGIVKSFSYALTPYIMRDSNYQLKYNDAITKSREMMKGYKMQLFCLKFGYFFHYILVFLTLGIYSLWLSPRVELANATFYEVVKKEYNERMRNEIVPNPQEYYYQNNNNGNMQSYQRQYPNNNNR